MRRPSLCFHWLLFILTATAIFATVPEIPPDWRSLLLPRSELTDDANALVRWRPAFDGLFPVDREIVDILQREMSPLVDQSDDSKVFESWLKPALKELTRFDLRPGESLQLPRLVGPETPFPDHQPLRQIAQLRVVAMKQAWQAGRRDEATALAIENLTLSRTLMSVQEGLIPLLNASGIWQLSLDAVYWLARQPDLTSGQAAELQAVLLKDDRLIVTALIRAFRGEFTFFTHLVIERMPRTHDVELLLSSIGSLGMAPPSAPAEGEPRLAVATRDPFDREATLQASADDIRGWVAAFETTARHPRALHAAHTYARLRGYSAEIRQLLVYATDETVPSAEQIALIDAEIASVDNPVGKLFLVITTSQWEPFSVSLFRREAQRGALTGLLAWRRLGKPAAWSELVAAELLPQPPTDPFSDGALKYDLTPTNPRIWSVGENGTDEGGEGTGENIGRPDDLTWPAGKPKS